MNRRKADSKKMSRQKTWSLYQYLAADLAAVLRIFIAENTHSFPIGFEDNPAVWHDMIRDMIWSFEEIAKEYPHAPDIGNKGARKWYDDDIQRGLTLFAIYFQDLWD